MLHVYTADELNEFISFREGEIKLGQVVTTLNGEEQFKEQLKESKATYVIFGIPEDIGVKMNNGNGGASSAFKPAIKALLNTQSNQFINGKEILILGYLDFSEDVKNFTNKDKEKGDSIVKNIDSKVSELIKLIVTSGKKPIIIGGGHNNAYGNLKGTAKALNKKINVVNMDAHTDFRKLEERHSGNGFSYAYHEGYLEKYFMFGLHENYTPQYILDKILDNIDIEYNTFEELEVYKSTKFESELQRTLTFINEKEFGIELDLDCVQYVQTSAMTPTGFSPREARRFIHYLGKDNNACYLHICEGAPSISNEKNTSSQIGKLISYLITDFIKSKQQ